jgi:L-fucose mutarotase/ribose pyranase (RbsD/FucU family)
MVFCRSLLVLGMAFSSFGCADIRIPFMSQKGVEWQSAVDRQVGQLGYRNWIVVAEASFPAHSRHGVRQVTADVDIPTALDYVLSTLERTETVRPQTYVTRELRSVENDFAPGIDDIRKRIKESLHGHEATENSALPYSSVFLELQPGYWDVESETRLRERIERERMQKIVRPQ